MPATINPYCCDCWLYQHECPGMPPGTDAADCFTPPPDADGQFDPITGDRRDADGRMQGDADDADDAETRAGEAGPANQGGPAEHPGQRGAAYPRRVHNARATGAGGLLLADRRPPRAVF